MGHEKNTGNNPHLDNVSIIVQLHPDFALLPESVLLLLFLLRPEEPRGREPLLVHQPNTLGLKEGLVAGKLFLGFGLERNEEKVLLKYNDQK